MVPLLEDKPLKEAKDENEEAGKGHQLEDEREDIREKARTLVNQCIEHEE